MSEEQNVSKADTPSPERLGSRGVDPRDWTGCAWWKQCKRFTGHGCDCKHRSAPKRKWSCPVCHELFNSAEDLVLHAINTAEDSIHGANTGSHRPSEPEANEGSVR